MAQHTKRLTPAPKLQPQTAAASAKGSANRERIVQAALNLFMERGYAETSIGDIAEASGLLKGNLCYYFATKAEMLEAVSQARQEELFARLGAALPPDTSARASLEAFLRVVHDSADEFASVGCPVGTLASQLGKSEPALQPYASRILRSLEAWLVQELARVLPKSAAQAHAEHLITLMQGAAVMAHAYRDPKIVHRQVKLARQWLAQILSAD